MAVFEVQMTPWAPREQLPDHPALRLADPDQVRQARNEALAESEEIAALARASKRHFQDGGPLTFPHREPKSIDSALPPSKLRFVPPKKRPRTAPRRSRGLYERSLNPR